MKTIYALAYNDYDGDQTLPRMYTNLETAEKALLNVNINRSRYEPLYEIWEYDLDED